MQSCNISAHILLLDGINGIVVAQKLKHLVRIQYFTSKYIIYQIFKYESMYLLLTINIPFSQGNNEINKTLVSSLKMVDDSFKQAIVSVRDDSQTFRNETSLLRNKTEESIQQMKTVLLDLFEELKRNITSYFRNQTIAGIFKVF